eukprot:CAMPEP_0116139008 /NCGR_PEP_ID=MMETSP0329-20121206/13076_1 /TAXON_ID=697910 /ORGANISM="Pseudo-nitzschia arenysensis, Strain B593" /LENGTH=385 /DNA_ID=CAMNT_0003634009 /DNA_START=97 /DNA_END=1254 /DNA_ORIENTATION=+
MSPPASSKGDNGGGKKDKTEKIAHSSNTNGNSPTGLTGSNSVSVTDFMTCLAKESNITKMTVECADGRLIRAVFKEGIPTSESKPGNGSADSTAEKAASEWALHYQKKQVSLTYSLVETGPTSSVMNGSVQKTNGGSGTGMATSLPPKKRAAVKADEGSSEGWNAMSALVDAATVAQREHEQVAPGVSAVGKVTAAIAMGATLAAGAFKKKPNKRKPRKIIPENKEYVEFTQKDVLFGRGGRSNHHPGNKIYREIVTNQQSHYRGCDKNEKTRVAQSIVDRMQNVVGGRFLELDRDAKRWFLVPNVVARRKVGQALRENNTEEARAAKRAKYQGRLNSKKKSLDEAIDVANGNGSVPMDTANSSAASAAAVNGIDAVEGSKSVEV